MSKIFFISDLHFSHRNIFKHCPKRLKICNAKDENDIDAWDEWLTQKWNLTISKKDIVYILGDFSFGTRDKVKNLLSKLNGRKFLILGNHDKSSEGLTQYFEQITQQKMVTFKKSSHSFLDEDFTVFMCHYALLTWPQKHYGVVQCMGHSHGNLDKFNNESSDLRVDVGIDGELSDYNFITLEKLYRFIKKKTKEMPIIEYVKQNITNNKIII